MLTDTEKFIDKELQAIGWPRLDLSNKQQTLGCIFSLLKQRSRDVGYREDLQQRIRILEHDNNSSDANLKKISAKLDSKSNEIKELKLLNDTLTSKTKNLTKQLQLSVEECKKSKSTLVQVKSQYEHEIRKLHVEKEKLKDKVSKLVTDKGSKGSGAITLSNPIDFQRSPEQQKNEDMYNIVISNCEDHEKELMAENASLRGLLLQVYQTLNQKSGRPSFQSTAQFHLPLKMVQESLIQLIEDALLSVTAAASAKLESMDKITGEIDLLKQKLDQQDQIITEQQKLLDLEAKEYCQPSVEAELEKLQQEKRLLDDDKQKLEDERVKFTDAAIKLGLERANLQRERLALEEEMKNAIAKPADSKHLISLASTPTWLKSKIRKAAFVDSNTSSTTDLHEQSWLNNNESPIESDGEDRENDPINAKSSDVLVESNTLNTPISVATKSVKSVRIQSTSSVGKEGFRKSAETVRLQSALGSITKKKSPFLMNSSKSKKVSSQTSPITSTPVSSVF